MKKLTYILSAAALVFCAISCQKELLEENPGQAVEEGTPVTLYVEDNLWTADGGKSAFIPGEGIKLSGSEQLGLAYIGSDGKIYSDTATSAYQIQAKGSNHVYTFTAPSGSTDKKWVAILPYSRQSGRIGKTTANPLEIGFKLSPVQFPSANSFDPFCDVLISERFEINAEGSATITKFKRMTAPLRLKIKGLDAGEKISAVSFKVDNGSLGSKNALTGFYYYTAAENYSDVVIYAAQAANTLANGVSAVYPEPLEQSEGMWPVWLSVSPISLAAGTPVTVMVQTSDKVYTKSTSFSAATQFLNDKINDVTVDLSKGDVTVETAAFQQFMIDFPVGNFTSDKNYDLTASDGVTRTWTVGGNILKYSPADNENKDFLKTCMEFYSDTNYAPKITIPSVTGKFIQKVRVYLHHHTSIASSTGSLLPIDIYDGEKFLVHYDFNMTTDCSLYKNAGYIDIPLPEGYNDFGGLTIRHKFEDKTKFYNYWLISGMSLIYVDDPYYKKPVEIKMNFSDCVGAAQTGVTYHFLWPFAEKNDLNGSTGSHPGQVVTYTLKDTDYKFKFFSTTGQMSNSKAGMGIGNALNDYFEFPAIEGLRLAKVTIINGSPNHMSRPLISDLEGNVIHGCAFGYQITGTSTSVVPEGQELVYELPTTQKNTAYRVQLSDAGKWCWIRTITLNYENDDPVYSKVIDVNLLSPIDETINWLFSSPVRTTLGSSTSNAKFPKERVNFVTAEGTFVIYSNGGLFRHDGNATTKSSGIGFGEVAATKETGDYIEIPAYEGMKLVKIDFANGMSFGAGPHVVALDGSEVSGGAVVKTGSKYASHTWNLSGTTANTAYRIMLTIPNWQYFNRLKVYYEPVAE